MAAASTIGQSRQGQALDTVQQIAQAITPFVGVHAGTLMLALGMIGVSLVATIVVTLTAARTLGELLGFRHSLEHAPKEAPWFYGVCTIALMVGGIVVTSGVDLVKLSVGVQVMNTLLLPIVLGFQFMLARRALPAPHRLAGRYAWVVGCTIVVTAGFGLYAGLSGIFA